MGFSAMFTFQLNLSFVKDEHTYGKQMARKDRTKVIYKGTFISKQSLIIYKVPIL